MSKVVCDISISVDGFVAGPEQTRDQPLGGGLSERLHSWLFETSDENRSEVDAIVSAGAYIMGRNMFGPIRGEWDLDWCGWWGDEPPYHAPVFVLTRHPREPLAMAGGTTFHFVADGIESALARARAMAGDRDVSIAGGASTVNQYLRAGHIDELRVHTAPVLLGAGERLFDGVPAQHLELVGGRAASLITHVTYRRAG